MVYLERVIYNKKTKQKQNKTTKTKQQQQQQHAKILYPTELSERWGGGIPPIYSGAPLQWCWHYMNVVEIYRHDKIHNYHETHNSQFLNDHHNAHSYMQTCMEQIHIIVKRYDH